MSSSDKFITLPYGTYIDSSNKLCITGVDKFELTSTYITERTVNSKNYIRLKDGTVLFADGTRFSNDKKLVDVYGRDISTNSYINLTKDVTIDPANATNQTIKWVEGDPMPTGTSIIKIPTSSTNTDILLAGNNSGYAIVTAEITNGHGMGNNINKDLLVKIGSPTANKLYSINLEAVSMSIYKGVAPVSIDLTAELIGSSQRIIDESKSTIKWSVTGGVATKELIKGTSITPYADDKSKAKLYIGRDQAINSELTIDVECGDYTRSCTIKILNKYQDGQPNVKTLRNFARNFTNLTSLNHIPSTVTGNDCLRNFLMGCTKFNQAIKIPDNIIGDRCLKYFMRDCTTFNKSVTISEEVCGNGCLHGFLYGASTFNKSISIPNGISGESCLERFLMKCTKFNQAITIPDGIKGNACLRDFLTECSSFNQVITIPDGITGSNSMDMFLRDCKSMTSNISISSTAAQNVDVNNQTLSCVYKGSNMISTGVGITGTGADVFISKTKNYLDAPPYRKLVKK